MVQCEGAQHKIALRSGRVPLGDGWAVSSCRSNVAVGEWACEDLAGVWKPRVWRGRSFS